MSARLAAGCMTGTSIDSIDAALLEITGRGLEMRARFVRSASAPLGELAPRLRRLAEQQPMTAGDIAALSRDFSRAHIPVLRELLRGEEPELVSVHGQTVFHKPPVSWQMLTPAVIAHEFKVPIVFDLRAADLAAGGQGAPVTPIADWVLFRGRDGDRERTIVNLGGFCNITRLPGVRTLGGNGHTPERVGGSDVCPCNHVLDCIARTCMGRAFDEDGRIASGGAAIDRVVESLRRVFPAGSLRSLGTGDELFRWVQEWKPLVKPADLAASACALIAERIGEASIGEVILAGGSVRNAALVSAIRVRAMGGVFLTDDLGVPASFREAACFAVLGALCQDRIPITLPGVTHVSAPAPISGCWILP